MSSVAKFYDLEAEKISADGEKISLFTKHPGTLGSFREARLRQYVTEHVPGRYKVSSGFISLHDPDGDNISDDSSKQIDCLIYDDDLYAPLLRSDDFVIVEPKSVAAVIEVKSDLTLYRSFGNDLKFHADNGKTYEWAGTLVDALNNILEAHKVLKKGKVGRDKYFASIIAYNSSALGQIQQALIGGELLEQIGIITLDQLPDQICVFQGGWYAFDAFKWAENPWSDPFEDADPDWSFMLDAQHPSNGGSLQLFTAGLDHAVAVSRLNKPYKIGGLRSGRGYVGAVENRPIHISSRRRYEEVLNAVEVESATTKEA